MASDAAAAAAWRAHAGRHFLTLEVNKVAFPPKQLIMAKCNAKDCTSDAASADGKCTAHASAMSSSAKK
jgi:hypothetical protein